MPGDILCCQNRLVLLASRRWKPGVMLCTPQGPGLFPTKNDLAADVNSTEAEKPHSRPLSEGGPPPQDTWSSSSHPTFCPPIHALLKNSQWLPSTHQTTLSSNAGIFLKVSSTPNMGPEPTTPRSSVPGSTNPASTRRVLKKGVACAAPLARGARLKPAIPPPSQITLRKQKSAFHQSTSCMHSLFIWSLMQQKCLKPPLCAR